MEGLVGLGWIVVVHCLSRQLTGGMMDDGLDALGYYNVARKRRGGVVGGVGKRRRSGLRL